MEYIDKIKSLGLSDKAARVYIANILLGETTILELSKRSGIRRTSIYYVIKELIDFGAIVSTRHGKKQFYIASEPKHLLRRSRERIQEFENSIEKIENLKNSHHHQPRVSFFYGPTGFKHVWDIIFSAKEKQFAIITSGESFLEFVKGDYILNEIIKLKKNLGFSSRQLIQDSEYARRIVVKDCRENRVSKVLPGKFRLPFTEIISDDFVVFISPKSDNLIMLIESDKFAMTRRSVFESLWEYMPNKANNSKTPKF